MDIDKNVAIRDLGILMGVIKKEEYHSTYNTTTGTYYCHNQVQQQAGNSVQAGAPTF